MRFGRASYTLEALPEATPRVLGEVRRSVEHRVGRVFPGDTVLDLVCGDGLLAVHLAARLTRARVVALDPRRDRLEATRENARREAPGAADRLALVEADPRHLPLQDEALQAVVTGADLRALEAEGGDDALAEVHRALFPWGKLLAVAPRGGPRDAEGFVIVADAAREVLAELGFGKLSLETLERYHGGRTLALLQAKKLDWEDPDDEDAEEAHEGV